MFPPEDESCNWASSTDSEKLLNEPSRLRSINHEVAQRLELLTRRTREANQSLIYFFRGSLIAPTSRFAFN